MNPALKSALDAYVFVLSESDQLGVYEAARAEGKAWQRCCLLGATRDDQTAARERVGR